MIDPGLREPRSGADACVQRLGITVGAVGCIEITDGVVQPRGRQVSRTQADRGQRDRDATVTRPVTRFEQLRGPIPVLGEHRHPGELEPGRGPVAIVQPLERPIVDVGEPPDRLVELTELGQEEDERDLDRRDVRALGRELPGRSLQLDQPSLLAAQEEQQERVVDQGQQRERLLADPVGLRRESLGIVVAAVEERPHRRPQDGPPLIRGDAERIGDTTEGNDLGVHCRKIARGKEIHDPGAMSGEQRGRRLALPCPLQEPCRARQTLLEIRLPDDARVVVHRRRRAQRERIAEPDRRVSRPDRELA